MLPKYEETILWTSKWIHRGIFGRWVYCGRNSDYYFRRAKEDHSYSHFLLGSILAAKDVWEIIGAPSA